MAQGRKYAALQDLDDAPDIYETPDLIDDASTLQTITTARSPSPTASDSSDANSISGITRRRLHPDQARSHFQPSRVDARDADFSGRLGSKRKSYRVSSRRRHAEDGAAIDSGEAEGDEDWSGEDEEEGLGRKLARLRREVQEVQAELEQRQHEPQSNGVSSTAENGNQAAGVSELGKILDNIRVSQRDAVSAHAELARSFTSSQQAQGQSAALPAPSPDQGKPNGEHAEAQDAQAVARIADFDNRLAALERALGISALDMPLSSSNPGFHPVLPTLDLLDDQMRLLTSSDSLPPHLDVIVQKMQQAPQQPTVPLDDAAVSTLLTPDDMTKLRSLYSLLPTISSLSPTLPPLLTRLRSLRMLHASAAGANEALDAVERRQQDTDKEIQAWKEGLDRVQQAVKDAEGGMQENASVIEGWVRDLEVRIKAVDVP